ncbi:uncharacterized protein LOC131680768 [Topomyia yanbarensis]|uniref:uncharacterized protein LOC131680768 n=1 Tax=Topomyia yanbarensis TaxID=2498891 RepID=UPI00273AFC4F|nr:uncharacterized protein LOC131680768 [Topomyia yanbarensis]
MKLLTVTSRNVKKLHRFRFPWARTLPLKPHNSYDGSFHQAVAPVLLLGQCLTLMPVVGIFNRNSRNTRFKLRSFRFIYSLTYALVVGVYVVLACRRCILKGLNVSFFGDLVYLLVVYTAAILFLFIAFRWHEILMQFSACESLFLRDPYNRVTKRLMKWSLIWRIRSLVFGIFVLAIVEDSLLYYSSYQDNIVQMDFCNRTNVSFWENFYFREYPQIFRIVPVNYGSVIIVEWINKCMRYTWTYLDMFIISFSFGAQFRYSQLYHRLASIEGVVHPANFWRDIRRDYVAVSQLVLFLDDKFGSLILLACANDMYFIATQLFNGFQRRPAVATMAYFWYSLILLIFRTICMLYVSSGVHVAAVSPLNLLRNVPSKDWCLDLQRLSDDVASGDNTLSGKKFFFLKRQIILAMAGTLVTYELVLMDQVKQAPDSTMDCSPRAGENNNFSIYIEATNSGVFCDVPTMDKSRIDDFWAALRPIIFVAQLFALFPVDGIFSKDVNRIAFRWISPRSLYSLCLLVLGALVIIAQVHHVASTTATASNIAAVLYYVFNYSGLVCFFVIAIQWRTVMANWRMHEEVFLHSPYLVKGRSLKFQVRAVGISILVLAFIEDVLHMLSCYVSNQEYMLRCDNSTPFWELFYAREHIQIFGYVKYSLPLALLNEFVHKIYLFAWSFMDLFITLISLSLSKRFEQFYSRIEHLKGKSMPDSFWTEIRQDYTRLSNLVGYMDGVLSPMIMVTCGSDLFFITYQLYMSVQINASPLSTSYYRISLMFLILRTLVMLLASSHIYVASRKPLNILRAVPMSSWTINVQRFTNEILNIDNVLSGHKFFFLKRKIILAMAGTMITYELVMLSEVKSTTQADFCAGNHRLF